MNMHANSRKKPKKIIWKLFLLLLLILLVSAGIYYILPGEDDFGTFLSMRNDMTRIIKDSDGAERDINLRFNDYQLKLNPLYAFMFKSGKLDLYMKSYSNDKLAAISINQLEIGRDTNNFFDFTFMFRPKPEFSLPLFHGDALKKLPGVHGALYMDFYALNANTDYETFFGQEIEKIEEAIHLAEPYWNHHDFGSLTPHLDPYKSPWRFEIRAPEKGDDETMRVYYSTAARCLSLYSEAYMRSVAAWSVTSNKPINEKIKEENRESFDGFVQVLYREDVAVKLGKMLFPEEDFDSYFLEGFWGIEPEGFLNIKD
ncbi:MAG: hypothetical protein JEY99_03885 [Spirochaetales bacterium]|nr:hypothetical protein [Spirochaetales bacterium]